ncbi:hypothetical protein BC835DRAFT_1329246 [Cytidiella melzeri]|nr:hypothetical protein BC835DRAFT_1329246 [Cytidiella melzeri]
MVEWNSPETFELCAILFRQTAVFVLGSYIWYLLLTFKDVEARLLLRRMRFRVAHIPYLLARYANLCELLTMVIANYITRRPHSCGPIAPPIFLTAVTGNVALAAASANLGYRVIVLWKSHVWFSRLLTAICVMHILLAILLGAFSIETTWDDKAQYCIVSPGSTQRGLLSLYLFTLVWHVVILVLTALGVRRPDLPRGSPLSSMLYHQMVGYAILTCVTCIPMATIVYLNLNSIMNIIPAIVGTTSTVMASSSAVISLLRLNDPDDSSDASPASAPRGHEAPTTNDSEKSRSSVESSAVPTGALTTHINIGYGSEYYDSRNGREGQPRLGGSMSVGEATAEAV